MSHPAPTSPGSSDQLSSPGRRDFLVYATSATAAVGTALALWPFIDSMNPSADVLALSKTDIDIASVAVGQRITAQWRGKPIFIAHRTPKEIEEARNVNVASLRDPQTDADRVVDPNWLIVIGICTHLGCIPLGQKASDPRGEWAGWFCPCHGSQYDTSGRIRKGPAPLDLHVPHYDLALATNKLTIGAKGGPKNAGI
jgi:ubiquinol-cytochrome c reductase iron-sulfur subunit